ncbi:hypothetical protein [Roseibium sp. RKSG952]|uniref:hypothetical protein n=1 Tax=Roseibium sp. RKSG952 TaxID=2529384 RepID=UPI0012BB5A9A|nr:hypothetical protein [Roseibium sp. RKSG952]MTH98365.1 hypothetical protein [Roseibium sp. RKSG952]
MSTSRYTKIAGGVLAAVIVVGGLSAGAMAAQSHQGNQPATPSQTQGQMQYQSAPSQGQQVQPQGFFRVTEIAPAPETMQQAANGQQNYIVVTGSELMKANGQDVINQPQAYLYNPATGQVTAIKQMQNQQPASQAQQSRYNLRHPVATAPSAQAQQPSSRAQGQIQVIQPSNGSSSQNTTLNQQQAQAPQKAQTQQQQGGFWHRMWEDTTGGSSGSSS